MPAETGTGGLLKLAYPSYTYEGVEQGFAKHDLAEHEKVAERLTRGRSLDVVKVFKDALSID